MQQLRNLAKEILTLVDRYEKVENSGETALAEMCLDAEALHFAADWMNGSDPPCVWGECPHGRADCSLTSEESGQCFLDLWRIKLRDEPEAVGVMRGLSWCAYCGTIVGEDKCGRPYRIRFARIVEAMESPKAALEQAQADLAHRDRALAWMAKIVSRYGECPEDECGQCLLLPEEHPVKMARPCDSNPLEIESQCWLALALAATEEKE